MGRPGETTKRVVVSVNVLGRISGVAVAIAADAMGSPVFIDSDVCHVGAPVANPPLGVSGLAFDQNAFIAFYEV